MEYNNFYDAFHFLNDHPIFKGNFQFGCLDIAVVRVNPETKKIDDNRNLNTEVNIWLECGPVNDEGLHTHDWQLDCGDQTFEEAIVQLANLVLKHYGSYKEPEVTAEELKEIEKFFNELRK